MKKIVTLLAGLSLLSFTQAQVVLSQFTWNNASLSPMTAAVGYSGISISSSATISTGGVDGTNGLNPGTPTHDIDLVLTGSYYQVNALDISVDFKRKETQASFFTMGKFDFGMNNGVLYLTMALDTTSSAGYKTVSNTNIYSIASDNNFHTYRFVYNNTTGVATVSVDGTVQYTYNGTANTSMYWTGAGNATVGNLMDGTGSNVTVLDNVVIKNNTSVVTLPVKLLSFDAAAAGNDAKLSWTTTQESDEKNFEIQRSTDGSNYETIGTVAATNTYSGTTAYSYTDIQPVNGKNFYRLKMVDIDGNFDYSDVKTLDFGTTAAVSIQCFPNPTVNYINVRQENGESAVYSYSLFTIDGKRMQAGEFNLDNGGQAQLNLSTAPKGILLLQLQNEQDHSTTTVKIIKG